MSISILAMSRMWKLNLLMITLIMAVTTPGPSTLSIMQEFANIALALLKLSLTLVSEQCSTRLLQSKLTKALLLNRSHFTSSVL
jgi:hypothetical protein